MIYCTFCVKHQPLAGNKRILSCQFTKSSECHQLKNFDFGQIALRNLYQVSFYYKLRVRKEVNDDYNKYNYKMCLKAINSGLGIPL